MLTDLFDTLSFPKLLAATRVSDPKIAEQPNPESTESKALAAIWGGPQAIQKAQVPYQSQIMLHFVHFIS